MCELIISLAETKGNAVTVLAIAGLIVSVATAWGSGSWIATVVVAAVFVLMILGVSLGC